MPITATHLLTNASTSNAASYTTSASITLTAGRLALAWIVSAKTATPQPVAPTITRTGGSITWVAVAGINFATITTGLYRLTLFRTIPASTLSGTQVIDFAGVTQQACGYAFSEFLGIDTSGTFGSGAIVRAVPISADTVTTISPSLVTPPFEAPNNATACGFSNAGNFAITPEGGWTELGTDIGVTTPNVRIESQYIIANDTSPSATWPTAAHAAAIAVEIRASDSQRRGLVTWLALEVPADPGGGPAPSIYFPRKPPR